MPTTKSPAGVVEFNPSMAGKPFIWRTALYGDVAVHVSKFSPNGAVANLTIDGGEASTPAQRFPVLSDGIGFAVQGQLFKRPATRARKAQPVKALVEAAGNEEITF
jgi:hypothetical protein